MKNSHRDINSCIGISKSITAAQQSTVKQCRFSGSAASLARRLTYFCVLLVFFGFILPVIAAAGEISYSAVVMDITGKVIVAQNGNIKTLDLGDLLYPGDVVELAENASLTINYLESGQQEQWPGGMKIFVGTAQSEQTPSEVQKVNKKIVLPQIQSPQKAAFTLRGAPSAGRAGKIEVAGLSNTAILEHQPAFRWSPADSVDIYTVTLYLEPGNEPLWQRTTTEQELPYPPDEDPLLPGARYRWEVEALKDAKVVAKKRSYFYLPDKDETAYVHGHIERFSEELSNNPDDTSARLAFISFLEHHRLYDAALKQYEIIQETHSHSSAIRLRQERLYQIRHSDAHY